MTDDVHFLHVACEEQAPVQYRACGLDNIWLRSGYEVREVNGQRAVSVRDAEELHKAIALHLAGRKKVLTGREVRFLRKFMGLTQAEMGHLLGVTDQTVARYEKDQVPFDGAADSLLRVFVTEQADGNINALELVSALREMDSAPNDTLVLELTDHEWKVAA